MQQYFIDENFENKVFSLSLDDSFHLCKVMRKNVNDKIYVVFKDKIKYICNIEEVSSKAVLVKPFELVTSSRELNLNITIAIPPLKNDKFDYLLQKATELGVSNIIIFNSERNVAKITSDKLEKKITRYKKILKEAAEQSKRSVIPDIMFYENIQALIKGSEHLDYKLIAYENEAENLSNKNLQKFLNSSLANKSVIAIFGSEGGLSRKEVEIFNDEGYQSIALGKRILRAETAPLYFISCAAYFTELNEEV